MGDRIEQGTEIAQVVADPVTKALTKALLADKPDLDEAWVAEARNISDFITPTVRTLMADAVRKAAFADLSVSRFAVEEVLPKCHKAKCHQHHPGPDEIVSLVWKRLRDTMIAQSIFVRHPDGEDECDGCLCPTEHDGEYGSAGHAGPCPPHTCALRFPPGATT